MTGTAAPLGLIILYSLVTALALFNTWMEMRRDLMMLQQNSYRNERYRRWLTASADTTGPWRLTALIIFFICLFPMATHNGGILLTGIFCAAHGISLCRRKYKLPLKVTPRVRRLASVFILLWAVTLAAALLLSRAPWPLEGLFVLSTATLAVFCASHLYIMAANIILSPVEKAINQRYVDDAARILRSMPDLRIIGITGSYGKTTTKHYLEKILSEEFDTLMTPGSFNTTMGVVRTVREWLKPFHQVFIVEMGAKQAGDIKEICDLVHPSAGIITAVGPQHLESFKTIENVCSTKFELADSIPADGLIVVNNDFDAIAHRVVTNCRCERYAVEHPSEACAWEARDITYSPRGSSFKAVRTADGHCIELETRILGACNISNILACVAMAKELGMSDEKIRRAVSHLEQVEHRLSVKRIPGGLTILDDAFNSNPVGSAMALDVLSGMPGHRFLITPGMIELGERQAELNEAFGKHAARCCDTAIVVGHYNREAIKAGLEAGGLPREAIITVDSFAKAQELLTARAKAGDTVLYENDLPDTFK